MRRSIEVEILEPAPLGEPSGRHLPKTDAVVKVAQNGLNALNRQLPLCTLLPCLNHRFGQRLSVPPKVAFQIVDVTQPLVLTGEGVQGGR